MAIKTSLNLKLSQSVVLYEVAEQLDVSLSFVFNSLARKIFKLHSFPGRFLQNVQYQPRINDDSDSWDKVPVSFEGDVYEKCLDLRKVFKLSVSFVFALGIDKYLDELIRELKGEKESDNYSVNYFFLSKGTDDFSQIILLWGMIEEEKLQRLYQLHHET